VHWLLVPRPHSTQAPHDTVPPIHCHPSCLPPAPRDTPPPPPPRPPAPEHEDAIIEAEWLNYLDQTCDDIEVHYNLKEVRARRSIARFPRVTTGRLTAKRLQNLLPPANLLTVSLCGTPSFVRDVRELYLSMGMPRSLLSTVG
jgi:hypothetical protein